MTPGVDIIDFSSCGLWIIIFCIEAQQHGGSSCSSVFRTRLFDSDPLTHCLCNVSSTSMKARFRLKKLQRQKQTVRSREMKYQEEEQEEEEKEGFGGGSGKLSWALVLR